MEINKQYKIWKATTTDPFREALEFIHFKGGCAYASDSHILIRIPLNHIFFDSTGLDISEDLAKLDGYAIRSEVFKRLAAFKGGISIEENNGKVSFAVSCWRREAEITFPLLDKGIIKAPNFEAILKQEGNITPIQKIGISASLLALLADAMGTKNVRLGFQDEKRQIIVRPLNDATNRASGVIMPRMVD